MRFVYGRQDWKTRERGEENCYLLTNGLGGFSSGTMIGSTTRNDYAVLMAGVESPGRRYNIIHRLKECVEIGERRCFLSSQKFVDDQKNESGYRYLDCFIFEDYPIWMYQVDGLWIKKELAMKQGENAIAIRYWIENRGKTSISFLVEPQLQFVPKGECLQEEQEFKIEGNQISSNGLHLFFQTNGEVEIFANEFSEGLYFSYDACDGRAKQGNTVSNHRIRKKVSAGEKTRLEILYSMENEKDTVDNFFEEAVQYRKKLVDTAGLQNPLAKMLVKSANQFISYRASTVGKTILAGYPFFEDWGRDTMIALSGCCISTGQLEDAKSILRTFARYCYKGMMPNLFPQGMNEPQYNTVDAALLFIYAVYLYYKKTKDDSFVQEMWTVMAEIIEWYQRGTDFNIHMDEDGLIVAGEGLDQVTWMDVRIDDILPTPRHGKPVEINAYWYNALCIMEEFGTLLEKTVDYGVLAQKVKQSFCEKFWNEKTGCLKDVLSGTGAEEQIRCNQIWAVSMPFTMLEEEKEKQVVDVVFEKLYTSYGLRTLEKGDPEYHASYGGEQRERDLAYHQGTVWVFPLGAYYFAYLKVNHGSKEACETVKRQLEGMGNALREGCIGQLPEIYDGEFPSSSKGCFAQAWSVGEILRVMEQIEQYEISCIGKQKE